VDKFIGDSVMAFWNAPHLQPDHVERACRAPSRPSTSLCIWDASKPGRLFRCGRQDFWRFRRWWSDIRVNKLRQLGILIAVIRF
jgi:hypothetical protein